MAGGPHRYRAPDFDTLADSPIVIGNPAVYEFTVDGKKHYLVNEGEGGVFDGARAAKDLEADRARAPAHVGLAALRPATCS